MLRLTLLAILVFTVPAFADVKVIRAPNDGQVPEVVVDAAGTVHMTYGKGQPGNGFYVQSKDGGKTFNEPARLNREDDTVTCGMERGPKFALGKDGVVHVTWLRFYKKGGGAMYTRSTDGGKTFEPERRLESPQYGLDNATLAADADGNVFVAWTGHPGGNAKDEENPISAPIVFVRSSDNGKTFSKNDYLKSDHPVSSHACGCCRLSASFGADGKLYIALRGGWKNIRDPYLLVGPKDKNDFHCVRISEDNWDFGCPMMGIPFRADEKGRVLAGWMSDFKAYWSISDEGTKNFRSKVATPQSSKRPQEFPLAVANAKGEVLFTWKEGDRVLWATYNSDGTATGKSGTAGQLPNKLKQTAFVGADGKFYIVF
jgi:hypothetical protein